MRSSPSLRLRSLASALIASAALLIAGAAPAHAGLLVKSAVGCGTPPTSQPFMRWSDSALYSLVSNGGLESGATDWTLSQSSVVSGNESYYVHDAKDTKSLYLPGGSSATTRAY